MHVVFRESHGLEETDTPQDLGQSPADLVVLSFSDSDLGAFAAGYHRARAHGFDPTLRLANLVALKHPLSVDTYAEQTLAGAKAVLVKLIGGESYWPYGLATLREIADTTGMALAVLPADGRPDARLDEISTLPVSTLRRLQHLCDAGGAIAAHAALAQLALAGGMYCGPVIGEKTVPDFGYYHPDTGATQTAPASDRPRVLVSFYRSYLTAADTEPVDALIRALEAGGFDAIGLFANSLKNPAAADWIRAQAADHAPAAIVNATAFSAQGADGAPSPLNASGCPVFQVALSTARRKEWVEAERGLSPADLAMHVVLPEVDGRIFAGVASFKQPGRKDPELEYSRFAHRADARRIAAVVARVAAWHRLATTAPEEKRLAVVLSTYPGREWNLAHAVGLDALASTDALLNALAEEGHDTGTRPDLGKALLDRYMPWPVAEYRAALARLPDAMREDLSAAWGDPESDPACQDGAFHFAALQSGKTTIALQPERGDVAARDDDYHDLARTPCHGYVAFYLWLTGRTDALIHVGAHGTLEWLPGKSVALSDTCWPEALTGPLPVIYPFIVNDPGEAAQAKRRIGAVTIGHLPPPLAETTLPANMGRLEHLLDEYSTADGLDPARRDRLIEDIREEARGTGVEADLGLDAAACPAEAITRIDRFVCDIKESQYGDGLHIFGTGDCGAEERAGLRAALMGRLVAPGPSGSPYRGRSDVLPTGRNLFTTDPRAVPSRAAHAQGVKLAEELLRRHLQDNGDWPRGLVVDLWGSATMRTAGEEFAMALHLLGAKPLWDTASERVTGIEILPLALLDRPRIDVTLRISGLFRDAFPALPILFGQAVRALCLRDEPADWNPFAGQAAAPRVYGPAPGSYGLGLGDAAEVYTEAARRAAGEAWLAASDHAFDAASDAIGTFADPDGLRQRVEGADAFVHLQDLPETDLLLAADYAAHEAGFAAAKALIGGSAALYHLDNRDPGRTVARTLTEEIARVVRARAAHPGWVAGMMRHGFRGGAELAATLDHMGAFAHLSGSVPPHLFDLYHDATLGQTDVRAFLERENPAALAAMEARFAALHAAGLWQTRRNSILASLPRLEDRA